MAKYVIFALSPSPGALSFMFFGTKKCKEPVTRGMHLVPMESSKILRKRPRNKGGFVLVQHVQGKPQSGKPGSRGAKLKKCVINPHIVVKKNYPLIQLCGVRTDPGDCFRTTSAFKI